MCAETLTIALPKGWIQVLEKKAREEGLSKGEFVRKQLKLILEKPQNPHEDGSGRTEGLEDD